MKVQLETRRGDQKWWDFSEMAMALSLFFPDRKADLNLGDEAFDGMKAELEKRRGSKTWLGFGKLALRLSILAAERAEIINGQILITPKLPMLTGEPKPLPVRSNIV